MDVVASRIGSRVGSMKPVLEADDIYASCFTHPAIERLAAFNGKLASRVLARGELRLFLASMTRFQSPHDRRHSHSRRPNV